MHIKKSNEVYISSNDRVVVTKMNHIVEIQHMKKINRQANIKKIDKNRYIELETGEIKDFCHSENRQGNINSLRQTMKKLRYLINNNFTGKGNELHITLTYSENMKDTKKLYEDAKNFMKKIRYKYKVNTSIDYINVVEPQERGAWHIHMLIRFNQLDRIYIKNSELATMWGHGFVQIKSLKDVDNIGAYLSAYLADLELTEDNSLKVLEDGQEVVKKHSEGKEKRIVKGGRLEMYPPGLNLFRKSKGIEYPKREEMPYKDIKKIVGNSTPNYLKSYSIQSGEFENTINYVSYNTKR